MQVPEILACSLEKYFAVQRKNAGICTPDVAFMRR